MKVPREIDELMWEIAEVKDGALETQFTARYPGFVEELQKRKAMVADLKGSKPTREHEIFVPSKEVRYMGPNKIAVVLASSLMLASVVFATYATMRYFGSRRIDEPIIPPTMPPVEEALIQKQPAPEPVFEEGIPESGSLGAQDGQPEIIQRPTPFMTLVSVSSENTSLSDVINNIASQAGITLTIAPGFEDKTIFILYENQPAIGILNDLGRRYGFTAFTQGKSEVLVIPARGSGSLNETAASGVANEVKNEAPPKEQGE